MIGSSEQKLKILTLGSFSVSVDDIVITSDAPRAGQVWKLFKYIVSNRGVPIPTDKIIDILWPDDDVDNPIKALYSLMYRLRGELNNNFRSKQDFILFRHNSYIWNNSAPYYLDAEEFELLCKEADDTRLHPVEREALYRRAIELYRGDYMSESSSESWVQPMVNYYKRLYTSAVASLCGLYKQSEDYAEIVRVCEKAIELDPYEESNHILLIEALVHQKQISQALAHYDYVSVLLYNELGVRPSEKLQALYKQIHEGNEDVQYNIREVMASLAEPDSNSHGAFLCDLDIFHKIYQLENRAIERSGQSVFLVCLTFTTDTHRVPPTKPLTEGISLMKKIAINSLRRGDVVTQYSKSQLLLLLPSACYENCELVVERIKKRFFENYTGEALLIQVNCEPIPAK